MGHPGTDGRGGRLDRSRSLSTTPPPPSCIISNTSCSRDFVSVGEFAIALEKVLRGFGLSVYADSEPGRAPAVEQRVLESNLQELASSRRQGV